MRNFVFFSRVALLLTGLIIVAGCDIIEEPFMTGQQQPGDNDQGEVVQKFLLEEFTGHQCPNCPQGTKIAKTLEDFYNNRLIIVAIHAGHFAEPSGTTYNYDFRTSEGEAMYSYFGIMANPIGMVNRTEFEGRRLMGPNAWGSAMAVIADEEPRLSIGLSLNHQSGNNYQLTANVTALSQLQGDYYLVAVITEDNIIKPQKINDPDYPEGYIPDYSHDNVLRRAITDIWGFKLNDQVFNADESLSNEFTFSISEQWDASSCSVVAWVMNQQMEIIQVEKIPFP